MSLFSAIKSLFGFTSSPGKLGPGDRHLTCQECDKQFVFDVGEQKFFKAKGFTDPKRCPTCRKKVRGSSRRRFRGRRGGGGGGGGGGRGVHISRRDSLIDGSSPYADER